MESELERLKAWMAANGHDEASLQKAMRYSHSICNILNGKRPMPDAFRWYFGRVFGNTALLEAFGIDVGDDRKCFEPGKNQRLWHSEKYAAGKAVLQAIQHGHLLPAKMHKCHGCNKQAHHHHHESYAPEDRLRVVPLCRSCHQQHHTGRKRLTFGVVPTAVGLIRISVAPAQEAQP